MNIFEEVRPTRTLVERRKRTFRWVSIFYYSNFVAIPLHLIVFLTSTPTPNHIVRFCLGLVSVFTAQLLLENSRTNLMHALEEESSEGRRVVNLKVNCVPTDERG